MDNRLCIGYNDNGKGFPCPNKPGTPWTPLWCLPCDERRRARITGQLEELQNLLAVDSVASAGEAPPRSEN